MEEGLVKSQALQMLGIHGMVGEKLYIGVPETKKVEF
jgi:hypothetical protein